MPYNIHINITNGVSAQYKYANSALNYHSLSLTYHQTVLRSVALLHRVEDLCSANEINQALQKCQLTHLQKSSKNCVKIHVLLNNQMQSNIKCVVFVLCYVHSHILQACSKKITHTSLFQMKTLLVSISFRRRTFQRN